MTKTVQIRVDIEKENDDFPLIIDGIDEAMLELCYERSGAYGVGSTTALYYQEIPGKEDKQWEK